MCIRDNSLQLTPHHVLRFLARLVKPFLANSIVLAGEGFLPQDKCSMKMMPMTALLALCSVACCRPHPDRTLSEQAEVFLAA